MKNLHTLPARIAAAALLAAIAAPAANVHIAGILRNADNSLPTGFVTITWDTFTRAATLYKAGSITAQITAGAVTLNLEPGYYTAHWGGTRGIETSTLYVPAGRSGTVPLTDCLITDTTALAVTNLAASGAAAGQTLAWTGTTWAPSWPLQVSPQIGPSWAQIWESESTAALASLHTSTIAVNFAAQIVEVWVWGGTGGRGAPRIYTGASSIHITRNRSGAADLAVLSSPLATPNTLATAPADLNTGCSRLPGYQVINAGTVSATCLCGVQASATTLIAAAADLLAGDTLTITGTPDGTQTWFAVQIFYRRAWLDASLPPPTWAATTSAAWANLTSTLWSQIHQ
jgi:hypothetical protein